MNKEKWITLFENIGLNEQMMNNWHRKFEKKYP